MVNMKSITNQEKFRGFHCQLRPLAQAKLVRVIKEEVFDISIDIRQLSSTFGKYVSEIFSEKNKKKLFIPKGFEHRFLIISNTSEFVYKRTIFYHPQSERCIFWNNKTLNISLPKNLTNKVSKKDLRDLTLNFSNLF